MIKILNTKKKIDNIKNIKLFIPRPKCTNLNAKTKIRKCDVSGKLLDIKLMNFSIKKNITNTRKDAENKKIKDPVE